MCRNRFLVVSLGDELGNAADGDRLLVPSGLSSPKFTLIGNGCYANNVARSWYFSVFLDISARWSRILILLDLHTAVYTFVPESALPFFSVLSLSG